MYKFGGFVSSRQEELWISRIGEFHGICYTKISVELRDIFSTCKQTVFRDRDLSYSDLRRNCIERMCIFISWFV